jgi:nitroreductase
MNPKISGFTQEQLLQIDPQLLLAIIREKAHSSVEVPLYQAIYTRKKLPVQFGRQLRNLLEIWKQRNLPDDRDDLNWCKSLLELASRVEQGSILDLPDQAPSYSVDQQKTIFDIIQTRRSVRIWLDKTVPESMIQQVMAAGLWAPHSCNLQTIRYLVLDGEDLKNLQQLKHNQGSPVGILVAQDIRLYEIFKATVPSHNRYLECGAAVQNMLLTAHALGLGAVWLTFEKGEAEELSKKFNLPDHISLTTYIAAGWPAQGRLAPGRISVEEAQIQANSIHNHQ